MPLYVFTGFQPTFINGLRDKDGRQFGYISPGEVVELTEVPVGLPFVPADDGGQDGTDSSADAHVQTPVPETPEPAPEPVPEATPVDLNLASQVIVH